METRWDACLAFMSKHKRDLQFVLETIHREMPAARKRLQDAKVRSAARVYDLGGKATRQPWVRLPCAPGLRIGLSDRKFSLGSGRDRSRRHA